MYTTLSVIGIGLAIFYLIFRIVKKKTQLRDFLILLVCFLVLFLITKRIDEKNMEERHWKNYIPVEMLRIDGEDNFTINVKIGIKDQKVTFIRKEIERSNQ